jgi:hypothetical protein
VTSSDSASCAIVEVPRCFSATRIARRLSGSWLTVMMAVCPFV